MYKNNNLLFRSISEFQFDGPIKKMSNRQKHIADVDAERQNVSIHAAIASISPLKKGRTANYFDGILADDTSTIRVVGFDARQQKTLSDYHQKNIPVEISNCEIKPAFRGDGYDVLMRSRTLIKESPKKLDPATLKEEIIDC